MAGSTVPGMGLWTDRRLPAGPRIDHLVIGVGLEVVDLTRGYGDGPMPFSYHYRGRAAAV